MADHAVSNIDPSIQSFLETIEDTKKRADSVALIHFLREVTGEEPKLWGSIVGFGSYHYKYDSGREGDSPLTGFSPRKQNLTLYIMSGFEDYEALLARLGKHKIGKACLYIKRLDDIDLETLKTLILRSIAHVRRLYPQ